MRLLLFGVVLLKQYFTLVTCSQECNSLIANFKNNIINNEKSNSPLYVDLQGCTRDKKLATIRKGAIHLNHDQSVLIGCPRTKNGQQNRLIVQKHETTAHAQRHTLDVDHIIAKCNNGKIEFSNFNKNLEVIQPNIMACQQEYGASVECNIINPMNYMNYTVYFNVSGGTVGYYSIHIMYGLLDSEKNALFTHISMQPRPFHSRGIGQYKRSSFFSVPEKCQNNNYRTKKIDEYYKNLIANPPPNDLEQCLQDQQPQNEDQAWKIVKGHLTANADFLTAPERAATFYYLNIAPQWNITNAGNFVRVENYVRRTARQLGRPLEVYTGTHGNALVNLDNDIDLEARSHSLRIPEVFWKLMYDPNDPKEQSALVFIVFNSPCPQNTDLLNALKRPSSKCNRQFCNDVGLMTDANAQVDVKGLVFCCESVADAIELFELTNRDNIVKNELRFLPDEVKYAKSYRIDKNGNKIPLFNLNNAARNAKPGNRKHRNNNKIYLSKQNIVTQDKETRKRKRTRGSKK